jgi:phosphoribosyl 1,2-cyclic phosphate phosphodiesterase
MTCLRVTILGCGASGGVPRLGPDWGAADPAEPKNRRRRCSILVERIGRDGERTIVLVDTSPDLREQLLDAGVGRLDGVLYTHDHADQSHGIDDLRVIAYRMQSRVDVYADDATIESLLDRFGYCFNQREDSPYPAILRHRPIRGPLQSFAVQGPGGALHVLPFDLDHGTCRSLGFRFGPVAYSPDAVGVPEQSFAALAGLECWIVDALRYKPHPTHANVETALGWLGRVEPRRGVLTNMNVELDYAGLSRELPPGVVPAHDGMVLEFDLPG